MNIYSFLSSLSDYRDNQWRTAQCLGILQPSMGDREEALQTGSAPRTAAIWRVNQCMKNLSISPFLYKPSFPIKATKSLKNKFKKMLTWFLQNVKSHDWKWIYFGNKRFCCFFSLVFWLYLFIFGKLFPNYGGDGVEAEACFLLPYFWTWLAVQLGRGGKYTAWQNKDKSIFHLSQNANTSKQT